MERRTLLGVILASVISLSALWFYVNHQAQTHPSKNGFGIYLSENNAQVIFDADVLHYNRTSHEITLTKECADRLGKMKDPLRGDFVVKIDGEKPITAYSCLPLYRARIHPPRS